MPTRDCAHCKGTGWCSCSTCAIHNGFTSEAAFRNGSYKMMYMPPGVSSHHGLVDVPNGPCITCGGQGFIVYTDQTIVYKGRG